MDFWNFSQSPLYFFNPPYRRKRFSGAGEEGLGSPAYTGDSKLEGEEFKKKEKKERNMRGLARERWRLAGAPRIASNPPHIPSLCALCCLLRFSARGRGHVN